MASRPDLQVDQGDSLAIGGRSRAGGTGGAAFHGGAALRGRAIAGAAEKADRAIWPSPLRKFVDDLGTGGRHGSRATSGARLLAGGSRLEHGGGERWLSYS